VPLCEDETRAEFDAEAHIVTVGEALVLAKEEPLAAAEKVGVTVSERLGVGEAVEHSDTLTLPLSDTVGDTVGGSFEGVGVREKLAELEGEPEARGEWDHDVDTVGGAPVLLTDRVAPPSPEGVGVPVRVGSGEREEEGVALVDTDSRALLVPPLPVATAEGDAVLLHVAVPAPEALPLPEALPAPPGERLPLPPVALTLTLPVSDVERVSAEEGMSVDTAELEGVGVMEEEPEPE
jgi:hypothetical protein